ncbi:MAG: subunit of tubulin prefoldin [Ramalina farinacea]|uniref:Subunit of tubulin prefoldin n=1 Tax=Ramalina farinacea TaxID=258253 RepID=A0AA43QT18_9LECA|nr:subunit of tubulin prefoldin [Ramalina farinacea]
MAANLPKGQAQPQTIDLGSLPLQQLNQVKNQLTQELQHLTTSFQQLKTAQAKFRDCITSVRDGLSRGEEWTRGQMETLTLGPPIGTPILVPLTPSLYVPGQLASTETVLVDIGTGFYGEKTPPAAQDFYRRKVEELTKNLGDLEKIVQGKQQNLGVVEDVLRRKVMEENSRAGASDGGGG